MNADTRVTAAREFLRNRTARPLNGRPFARVAREGYAGFMGGHRVVVPGRPNRVVTLLPRLLPRGATMAVMQWRWVKARRRGG